MRIGRGRAGFVQPVDYAVNARKPEQSIDRPTPPGRELSGSRPFFPTHAGRELATSQHLPDFSRRRAILDRLTQPGDVRVYSTDCRAGERLRVQMCVPVLPLGGAAVPAFAVIAQSLPYSADVHKLPVKLPAGYSAVVAPPPSELVMPARDPLTRVRYYAGPTIDTRTLVSGRCYIVVWSPGNQMGKYVLQVGHRWPWRWTYWLNLPRAWWEFRGWFGLSRTAAYVAGALVALVALLSVQRLRRRRKA